MTKKFIAETLESARSHTGSHDIHCDVPNLMLIVEYALEQWDIKDNTLLDAINKLLELCQPIKTDAVGRYDQDGEAGRLMC